MLPSSLTLLVEIAVQLAWPLTQALFHSLWIGVLVAASLRMLERLSTSSSGETDAGSELAARHRFTLSLSALVLVAASLPIGFSLFFNRAAFDEAIAAAGSATDVVPESSAYPLDAMPLARAIEDSLLAANSEARSFAVSAAKASPIDASDGSAFQRLKAGTRRVAPVIAALYGAGTLVMLLRLAIGICGGRRLAKGGQLLSDSALMASLQEQVNRLEVSLRPLVSTCERVAVPVVVGVARPVILLPVSLLSGLAPEDVERILAHELAHLRRRDHLTVLVQRGLEAILFYHPAAWWLGRRIDALREDACDDLVLASGVDRLGYATTLLRVAELRTNVAEKRQLLSQLALDGGHPSMLRRRIERIVESKSDPGVRVGQSRAGLALLTACVTLALAFLVQLPVQSQIASPPEATANEENAGDGKPDSMATRSERTSDETATGSLEPEPIRQKLSSRTDFTAEEMPLLEVLDFVERKSGVPITISLGECMLRGVSGQSSVSLEVKDATFAEILNQATLALNLTFEITPDGIRIPAKTPAFEFRIVPELPTSSARVRLPENWKENTYRDGTGGEANVGQHPGFAWFPVQPIKDDSITVPVMESRGATQIALLSDDAQHIATPDGSWQVKDVRLEDDPSGQKRLAMTVDEVGGARIRKLTQAAMNQKIAMLVHGVVIMAPTVRSEIGEQLAISGGFSDEQWRLIEKSVKQAIQPSAVEDSSAWLENEDGVSDVSGQQSYREITRSDFSKLTVGYEMSGSDEEARIFIERTSGAEGEIGSQGNRAMKWTPLKSGNSFELKKLLPGDYQVARIRELDIVTEKDPADAKRAHRITTTALLDRHRITLRAGQQKTIDLSRKGGQRVSGSIERADDVKPARMILYVCSPDAKGLDDLHSLETVIFDAQQCNDGEFTTDRLEPGNYSLIAVGYDAWPREAFFQTGFPRPSYIGRIQLSVPRDGQVNKPRVPLARIPY